MFGSFLYFVKKKIMKPSTFEVDDSNQKHKSSKDDFLSKEPSGITNTIYDFIDEKYFRVLGLLDDEGENKIFLCSNDTNFFALKVLTNAIAGKTNTQKNICPAAGVFSFKIFTSKEIDEKPKKWKFSQPELSDFIPGISLFDLLQTMHFHGQTKLKDPESTKRYYTFTKITLFTILFGIAKFINDYHLQKNTKKFHGRINTYNIQIDKDMHPHVLSAPSNDARNYVASSPQQYLFTPPEDRNEKSINTKQENLSHDVYSFGVCIKHVIYQQFPFPSIDSGNMNKNDLPGFSLKSTYNFRLPDKELQDYEKSLITLADMCMNNDPSKRPPSHQVAEWIYQGASLYLNSDDFQTFNNYACTLLPINTDPSLICGTHEKTRETIDKGFIYLSSGKGALSLCKTILKDKQENQKLQKNEQLSDQKTSKLDIFFDNMKQYIEC